MSPIIPRITTPFYLTIHKKTLYSAGSSAREAHHMHGIQATHIAVAEFVIATIFLIAGAIVTRERFQKTQKSPWTDRFLFWASRGRIKEDGWKKYLGITL